MRYLMTISYDGSLFHGYQKQRGKRTVQEEIEKVLCKLNKGKPILVHGAGRTDKGVHARGQRLHFDYEGRMTGQNMKAACRSLLPNDIFVKEVVLVSDTFHARYDVKAKEYRYYINMGEYQPWNRAYCYQYGQNLDLKKIEKGLSLLEGTHNFKAFTKATDQKENSVRTIYRAYLKPVSSTTMMIGFIGTGFLRYMVRNMVGTLIEIGEGKRSFSNIKEILSSLDRTKAGKTAPAQGLFLETVYYEEKEVRDAIDQVRN